MLGNDGDCESCGTSYNAIYYSWDSSTYLHTVRVAIGCHGGSEATAEIPGEVVNLVAPYRDWPGGDEVNELIRWLCGS